MSRLPGQTASVCRACLQATRRRRKAQRPGPAYHYYYNYYNYSTKPGAGATHVAGSSPAGARNTNQPADNKRGPSAGSSPPPPPPKQDAESEVKGAMTRRLEEATEETLLTGGRAGRRAVEDAGFSEELKDRLLDKIAGAEFRREHAGAFSAAEINPAAGEGTRGLAASEAWTGEERQADAVLRMLDDARRPLRPGARGKFAVPEPVDMRIRREPALTGGQRIARAREKAASYADGGGGGGTVDKEKEERRAMFRERFTPGAMMPNSISGLEALANERIENAISRGQFRDIPRGPGAGVGGDDSGRAGNPFIDTTEYIMNKMIQRQDMRPPWIEKQQEVRAAIGTFRARLRSDWRRHAARMIAAEGGSLEGQMARAEGYARAEVLYNPSSSSPPSTLSPSSTTTAQDSAVTETTQQQQKQEKEDKGDKDEEEYTPPRPYRDPAWEQAEHAYMSLSVDGVNALTRSYNLMAPELAKKPYFSLRRELDACYAETAPLLAAEIRHRAARPPPPSRAGPAAVAPGGGVLENLRFGESAVVDEVPTKAYGFKELWRDLFKKNS
ncbi:hypothetical protein N3K66_006559 [Trichothecium roseum]|uniref:Uncharacterized protein n=1 Tax=Trichothecium roseum TaxID=47278 RepID=A0ACC0UVU4_9HYPO|nr:hypothetical protein N3K66_006559 [Trichothecium roseum]